MYRELYDLSAGRDVGLSLEDFTEALINISQRFDVPLSAEFCRSLHLQDVALAQACSRGSAAAWERFLDLYRSKIYAAALTTAKNAARAHELSEELLSDLFGTGKSKLASYSGRGSLEGWLKAVLARAYIDRCRSQRKYVSMDERMDAVGRACFREPPARYSKEWESQTLLREAVEQSCRERTPEQQFLLAAYFFDSWTLSQIAAPLGVHESTVSRRIDQLLRDLRKSIVRTLRQRGMSVRQIEELMQSDVRELQLDIRGLLLTGAD